MKMRYCKKCRTYTLHDECKTCGEKTVNPHPPRFSPSDPYGAYRRKMKGIASARSRDFRLPNGRGVKSG